MVMAGEAPATVCVGLREESKENSAAMTAAFACNRFMAIPRLALVQSNAAIMTQ